MCAAQYNARLTPECVFVCVNEREREREREIHVKIIFLEISRLWST